MDNLYNLHKEFDKINDEIMDYKIIEPLLDEYTRTKEKLNSLSKEIIKKTSNTNYIFDPKTGILLNKDHLTISIDKSFKYKDKNTFEEKNIHSNSFITPKEFSQIEKYLTNDKEKITELINNSNKYIFLSDIKEYINNLCCGICLTNNIVSLEFNEAEDTVQNYLLCKIIISQIENNIETFYGKIEFRCIYEKED